MANESSLPKPAEAASPDHPHSLAAEAAVLGSILFDNHAYSRVNEILIDDDFYAPHNREIYAVAKSL
ncbi:MAG: DnaB-like helicase N-terminal domain-containing protein, partial [Pseudomonadota bacterium]